MKQKVVNYDGYDYDYSTYWKDRQYENNAEHIALEKLLKNRSGDWFVDIGGSYGRLTDTYSQKYKNCIILDYSLKTLKRNYASIIKKFPNVTFIAANAYKTPFKDSVFDGGMMVRVLHHIKNQKECFQEISRIFQKDGIYIQEFANKIHIKARIRAFLIGDKEIKTEKPYQQPTISLEGAKGDGVYFLNYHPEHVKDLLNESGFKVVEKQGCSYLRIPLLKKLLGTKILTFAEKILQIVLAKTNIPPSIFFSSKLNIDKEQNSYKKITDILACPVCKSTLKFENDAAFCEKCNRKYFKKNNIWDFRVE